jgi:O-antigen ligase
MRSRAETIGEFRTETSAATRLQAWSAASGMIADHPLTGVGLASFGPAFPDYSDNKPREAHNTFFQITAESGVLAGSMYILIVTSAILALRRNGSRLRKEQAEGKPDALYLINEATLVALCGLVVCSLFLSLQMFEIFYCLCLMINALLYVRMRAERGEGAVAVPAQRGPRRLRKAAAPVAAEPPASPADEGIAPGRARPVAMLRRRT